MENDASRYRSTIKLLAQHHCRIDQFLSKSVTHIITASKYHSSTKITTRNPMMNYTTRARQLVNLSLKKYQGTFGTLKVGREIETLSPSCLPDYSDKCTDVSHKCFVKRSNKITLPKVHVRELNPLFLKVEDCSGRYRPQVIEMREWPKIYFHSHASYSTFYNPSKEKPWANSKTKHLKEELCELCDSFYNNRQQHIKSFEHQNHAKNDKLFASLDKAIAMGPSITNLLKRTKYI